MMLAKGKNGRIGRKLDRAGFDAQVEQSSMGERRGNLYLSTGSIEADDAYWREQEAKANAQASARAARNLVRRQGELVKEAKRQEEVKKMQRVASFDPMNERLKKHFGRMNTMGETERVASQLTPGTVLTRPADFSSSGANPEIIVGNAPRRIEWSADFRQHKIVGNPLTRDGEYGPAVTDFDRFVRGTDVNQDDVVKIAGGTMLGRYDGQHGYRKGMGFDFSWDGIKDAFSNTVSQTADNLVEALPAQLSQELQEAITGGGQVQSSGGGVVNVTRPVTGTTSYVQQSLGVPPWAIYAGLGLIGVGLLAVILKK